MSSDEKNATVTIRLRADSGYESEEKHRISPEQWGEIVGIVNKPDDCTSCGTNLADGKTGLCVGCDAYSAHTS